MSDKRWLMLSAKQIELRIDRSSGIIGAHFDLSEASLGLMPELQVGVALTPDEARHLARALLRTADEAEAE